MIKKNASKEWKENMNRDKKLNTGEEVKDKIRGEIKRKK